MKILLNIFLFFWLIFWKAARTGHIFSNDVQVKYQNVGWTKEITLFLQFETKMSSEGFIEFRFPFFLGESPQLSIRDPNNEDKLLLRNTVPVSYSESQSNPPTFKYYFRISTVPADMFLKLTIYPDNIASCLKCIQASKFFDIPIGIRTLSNPSELSFVYDNNPVISTIALAPPPAESISINVEGDQKPAEVGELREMTLNIQVGQDLHWGAQFLLEISQEEYSFSSVCSLPEEKGITCSFISPKSIGFTMRSEVLATNTIKIQVAIQSPSFQASSVELRALAVSLEGSYIYCFGKSGALFQTNGEKIHSHEVLLLWGLLTASGKEANSCPIGLFTPKPGGRIKTFNNIRFNFQLERDFIVGLQLKLRITLSESTQAILEGSLLHNIDGAFCKIVNPEIICEDFRDLKSREKKTYFVSVRLQLKENTAKRDLKEFGKLQFYSIIEGRPKAYSIPSYPNNNITNFIFQNTEYLDEITESGFHSTVNSKYTDINQIVSFPEDLKMNYTLTSSLLSQELVPEFLNIGIVVNQSSSKHQNLLFLLAADSEKICKSTVNVDCNNLTSTKPSEISMNMLINPKPLIIDETSLKKGVEPLGSFQGEGNKSCADLGLCKNNFRNESPVDPAKNDTTSGEEFSKNTLRNLEEPDITAVNTIITNQTYLKLKMGCKSSSLSPLGCHSINGRTNESYSAFSLNNVKFSRDYRGSSLYADQNLFDFLLCFQYKNEDNWNLASAGIIHSYTLTAPAASSLKFSLINNVLNNDNHRIPTLLRITGKFTLDELPLVANRLAIFFDFDAGFSSPSEPISNRENKYIACVSSASHPVCIHHHFIENNITATNATGNYDYWPMLPRVDIIENFTSSSSDWDYYIPISLQRNLKSLHIAILLDKKDAFSGSSFSEAYAVYKLLGSSFLSDLKNHPSFSLGAPVEAWGNDQKGWSSLKIKDECGKMFFGIDVNNLLNSKPFDEFPLGIMFGSGFSGNCSMGNTGLGGGFTISSKGDNIFSQGKISWTGGRSDNCIKLSYKPISEIPLRTLPEDVIYAVFCPWTPGSEGNYIQSPGRDPEVQGVKIKPFKFPWYWAGNISLGDKLSYAWSNTDGYLQAYASENKLEALEVSTCNLIGLSTLYEQTLGQTLKISFNSLVPLFSTRSSNISIALQIPNVPRELKLITDFCILGDISEPFLCKVSFIEGVFVFNLSPNSDLSDQEGYSSDLIIKPNTSYSISFYVNFEEGVLRSDSSSVALLLKRNEESSGENIIAYCELIGDGFNSKSRDDNLKRNQVAVSDVRLSGIMGSATPLSFEIAIEKFKIPLFSNILIKVELHTLFTNVGHEEDFDCLVYDKDGNIDQRWMKYPSQIPTDLTISSRHHILDILEREVLKIWCFGGEVNIFSRKEEIELKVSIRDSAYNIYAIASLTVEQKGDIFKNLKPQGSSLKASILKENLSSGVLQNYVISLSPSAQSYSLGVSSILIEFGKSIPPNINKLGLPHCFIDKIEAGCQILGNRRLEIILNKDFNPDGEFHLIEVLDVQQELTISQKEENLFISILSESGDVSSVRESCKVADPITRSSQDSEPHLLVIKSINYSNLFTRESTDISFIFSGNMINQFINEDHLLVVEFPLRYYYALAGNFEISCVLNLLSSTKFDEENDFAVSCEKNGHLSLIKIKLRAKFPIFDKSSNWNLTIKNLLNPHNVKSIKNMFTLMIINNMDITRKSNSTKEFDKLETYFSITKIVARSAPGTVLKNEITFSYNPNKELFEWRNNNGEVIDNRIEVYRGFYQTRLLLKLQANKRFNVSFNFQPCCDMKTLFSVIPLASEVEIGSYSSILDIAAKEDCLPGIYYIQWEAKLSEEDKNWLSPISPLELVVSPTKCQVDPLRAEVELGMEISGYPIIFDFGDCQPVQEITIKLNKPRDSSALVISGSDSIKIPPDESRKFAVFEVLKNSEVDQNNKSDSLVKIALDFEIQGEGSRYYQKPKSMSILFTRKQLLMPVGSNPLVEIQKKSNPDKSVRKTSFKFECSEPGFVFYAFWIADTRANLLSLADIVKKTNRFETPLVSRSDEDQTWSVYGYAMTLPSNQPNSNIVNIEAYGLRSNSNYSVIQYCLTDLKFASKGYLTQWTEPDNNGRNIRVDLGFESALPSSLKRELACILAVTLRIGLNQITTDEGTHCETLNSHRLLSTDELAGEKSQQEAQENTRNAKIQTTSLFCEPNYSNEKEDTLQAVNELFRNSTTLFEKSIISKSALRTSYPKLLSINISSQSLISMQEIIIPTFNTSHVSDVSSSYASVSLKIKLNNTRGFIFVALSLIGTPRPNRIQLRKGLDGKNNPLMSREVRESLENQEQTYSYSGLKINTRYVIYYMASAADPSINSRYSEIFEHEIDTLSFLDLLEDYRTRNAIIFGITLGVGIPLIFLLVIWIWNSKNKFRFGGATNATEAEDVIAVVNHKKEEDRGLNVELINKKKYVDMEESVRYNEESVDHGKVLKKTVLDLTKKYDLKSFAATLEFTKFQELKCFHTDSIEVLSAFSDKLFRRCLLVFLKYEDMDEGLNCILDILSAYSTQERNFGEIKLEGILCDEETGRLALQWENFESNIVQDEESDWNKLHVRDSKEKIKIAQNLINLIKQKEESAEIRKEVYFYERESQQIRLLNPLCHQFLKPIKPHSPYRDPGYFQEGADKDFLEKRWQLGILLHEILIGPVSLNWAKAAMSEEERLVLISKELEKENEGKRDWLALVENESGNLRAISGLLYINIEKRIKLSDFYNNFFSE